ncbi:MAG: hypothetical protein NW206_01805 [Hyphomonadaceae bacterium]|nr:hypothetical protein [Hyphomonadaceae bacterium]
MSAITSPALALTRAFDRFDRASARVLNAAQGASDVDLPTALVDQRLAITEVKAIRSSVQFADEMWKALLEIGEERAKR